MRPIQNYLLSRLKNKIQTTGNNNEIRSHVRLSRPTTVLENDLYLEKLPLGINNCDDCSIAVAHETPSRRNSRIDIMYIENGVAKWCISPTKYPMEEHVFVDTGFMESATSCSICYDSNTKLTRDGIVEMLTYGDPWLFWTDPLGELWCQNGMDKTTRISLATSNVSDVTAIRGLYNSNPNYDYGLVLFFILGGTIYYRQYQNKTWTDAVAIGFGPSATYVEISATRSWDTRIFLQARTSTGAVYEIVSQQQGFAKNDLGENIGNTIASIDLSSTIQDIVTLEPTKHKTENLGVSENLLVSNVGYSDEPISPEIISARNISISGNYGLAIEVDMTPYTSVHVKHWSYANRYYKLRDSRGVVYSPYKVIYDELNSAHATLLFINFNSARGLCSLTIESGVLTNVNDRLLPTTSYHFTPVGLVPPPEAGPKPISITNSTDGKYVYVEFDKDVYTSDLDFNISYLEVYVLASLYPNPELEPVKQSRTPTSLTLSGNVLELVFGDSDDYDIRNFNNYDTHVAYYGGNLQGNSNQDVVSPFDVIFVPTGMLPSNDQWTGMKMKSTSTINVSHYFTDITTLEPSMADADNLGKASTTIGMPLVSFEDIGDV